MPFDTPMPCKEYDWTPWIIAIPDTVYGYTVMSPVCQRSLYTANVLDWVTILYSEV
jgi:hypothetical protein